MKLRQLFVILALLVCAGGVRANSDVLLARLQPQGYVNDFAGVLPAPQRAALETFLTEFERQTGVEIAVVAVSSLDGGEVDDFTNRLFQKWRVGKKGKDNGVMILAAIQDRKARIEVGYGLEGVLPDALAGRILREQMFPLFKQGRYDAGLERAVRIVAATVSGHAGGQLSAAYPADNNNSVRHGENHSDVQGIKIVFFIIFFVVVFFIQKLNGHRSRYSTGFYSYGGGFSGGGGSGGFSGFGGGSSGGGGASGGW